MYGVPNEASPISQMFTLVYFLWGTVMVAGAIGAYAAKLIRNTERRRILRDDVDDEALMYMTNLSSNSARACLHCVLVRIGWYQHTEKYVTILASMMWMLLGIFYGIVYEKWPVGKSVYFAVSGMAGTGMSPPECPTASGTTECSMGSVRAICIGTFIIVGIPLFTYTMGQFAGN
jgi:hypothetical protein